MRRIACTLALPLSALLVSCTGSGAPEPGGAVIAVRITPNTPVVQNGAALSFAAVAITETGESKDVTDSPSTNWESSAPSVVSINADGTGEAETEGTAYITAEVSGITSPAQLVTVNPAPTATPTPPPVTHLVI